MIPAIGQKIPTKGQEPSTLNNSLVFMFRGDGTLSSGRYYPEYGLDFSSYVEDTGTMYQNTTFKVPPATKSFYFPSNAYFSRSSSYIPSSWLVYTNITFSFWMYKYSISGQRGVLSWGPVSNRNFYVVSDGSTLKIGHDYSGVEQQAEFAPNLNNSTWYHIVVVRNTTEKRYYLYVNNELDAYLSYSYNPTTSYRDIYLGSFGNGLYPFYGYMNFIAYWKRALTTDEIAELYNTPKYPF